MRKNFWCAVILALVAGFIGLQNFYLGKYVRGVFDVLFAWTGIPALIAFIEAVIWLFDGPEEWNKKYNKTETLLMD